MGDLTLEPDLTKFLGTGDVGVAMPPADERRPYLVLMDGAIAGRSVAVYDEPVLIGRGTACHLAIDDPAASRQHARVEINGDQAQLVDLMSTNGTYVDGQRVPGSLPLKDGSLIQIGRQLIWFEWRRRTDIESVTEMAKGLEQARQYVFSLLPDRISDGPVRVDWVYEPSTKLGGDVFGYQALDRNTAVGYMVDVSGHGVGAAMRCTTILGVLRQQALPGANFRDPGHVLSSLNDLFPMDERGGHSFAIWYGVYDLALRTLLHGSAGHHPAYLVSADRRQTEPLTVDNPRIGVSPGVRFREEVVQVPPGSTLYLFSDGAFTATDRQGRPGQLDDFVPLLSDPMVPGVGEPRRLYDEVRRRARPGPLPDDCSLMTVTFP